MHLIDWSIMIWRWVFFHLYKICKTLSLCFQKRNHTHVAVAWRSWGPNLILYDCIRTAMLRIPAMYEAKNSKICNFWMFWPVIQLINHLFQIRQKMSLHFLQLETIVQKSACPILKRWYNNRVINQNI